MLIRLFLVVLTIFTMTVGALSPTLASPRAFSGDVEQRDALLAAMGTPELLRIVRDEGVGHASVLEADLFPGRGGDRWTEMVAAIYDTGRTGDLLRAEFATALAPDHIETALKFFESEIGARIVGLEISARSAMLAPSVEDAGREIYYRADENGSERLRRIEVLADLLDLIERNVSGSLNANLAFYEGVNAGGGFGEVRSEADVLRDVWEQEPEVRQESEVWVLSYLFMAYQPLTDAEVETYIAFSGSPAGQAVNAAVFAGFDRVFRVISRELGLASAQFMSGEDL